VPILRIEIAGSAHKARSLFFSEDRPPRATSAAAVRELAIAEGDARTTDEIERALGSVEPRLANDRALRLLGYRERSTAELSAALRDSGYPAPVVAIVVARMQELGLVDDERFAELWVRSRLAAGFGPRRIARELAEKGVDPDVARVALDTHHDTAAELERARAYLGGRRADDRRSRERLVRRLVARGYDVSVALQAIRSLPGDGSGSTDE
jgi:regulatory protein